MTTALPCFLSNPRCARHVIPFQTASRSSVLRRRQVSSSWLKNHSWQCAAASASQPADSSGQQPSRVVVPDSIIDPDGRVEHASLTPEQRRHLWKIAIKAPMYSVGIIPILVSASAVYLQTNHLDLVRTLLLCIASICIIAWLNLSNDVFDSQTGVDTNKPESVVNLTGSRVRVFLVAHALLAAGGYLLYRLLAPLPDPQAAKMLGAAVGLGYLYQGPPFRFSYLGLGEPLCFVAFGPLATCAFYLAQAPPGVTSLNPMIYGLSLLLGLSTMIILFCSHFHQVEGDRAAGKMSPLVRWGGEKCTEALKFFVGITHTLALGFSIFGVLPLACWTSVMVSYGFANKVVKFAEAHRDDAAEVKPLKLMATQWHIAFGLMLVMGLLLQKIM